MIILLDFNQVYVKHRVYYSSTFEGTFVVTKV